MNRITPSSIKGSGLCRTSVNSARAGKQNERSTSNRPSTRKYALAALVIVLFVFPVVKAETVTFGTGGVSEANGFPFGGTYSGEYQEIYGAAGFLSPFTIRQISFDASNFGGELNGSATASYDLTLSLGATSSQPNSPGSFSSNSSNLVAVFDGVESAALTPTLGLTFYLSTPFTFDPVPGQNLALDVMIHSESSSIPLGFAYDSSSTQMGWVFQTPSLGIISVGDEGLVTHFSGDAVTAAPLTASGPAGLVLFTFYALSQFRRKFRHRTVI